MRERLYMYGQCIRRFIRNSSACVLTQFYVSWSPIYINVRVKHRQQEKHDESKLNTYNGNKTGMDGARALCLCIGMHG